jgi:hypothetical protein
MLMRHFLRGRLSTRAQQALAPGMIAPSLPAGLVLSPGGEETLSSRLCRARPRTVPVPPITGPAKQEREATQRTATIEKIHAAARAAVDLRTESCESFNCVGSTGLGRSTEGPEHHTPGLPLCGAEIPPTPISPSHTRPCRRWQHERLQAGEGARRPTPNPTSQRRAPCAVRDSARDQDPGEVKVPRSPALVMAAIPPFLTVVSSAGVGRVD